jgi:MoxR-like ATPase
MPVSPHNIACKVCGQEIADFLPPHLKAAHGMTVPAYLAAHPNAPTTSKRLVARVAEQTAKVVRTPPPDAAHLTVTIGGLDFPVNLDVPEEACLPMPPHYKTPAHGALKEDILHALIALKQGRSSYIWGLPGSGKDALFHAWSMMTRTPAIIQQVAPGTDIESWFFSRGFDDKGTFWEEGEVLKALRDGYTTTTGRRVPYMLLVSDFDRADREQAEHLRLITDSIMGRVKGPAGKVFPVLAGTRVVATANSAGGGDERGRMISANPIDASILDRFERKFQFHWMAWEDESEIVKAKFPTLFTKAPSVLTKMKEVTKALREAILNGDLHGEFSHRGLCDVLGHAEDLILCNGGKVPAKLLKTASRAWVDGLPDEENRDQARKIMDPHLGTLDVGPRDAGSSDDLGF